MLFSISNMRTVWNKCLCNETQTLITVIRNVFIWLISVLTLFAKEDDLLYFDDYILKFQIFIGILDIVHPKVPFSGNWYNRNLKIKYFQIHFKSITRNLHVCTNALLHHMSKFFLKNETLSVKLSTIKCKQYSTKLLTYKKVLFGSWMYRYLHTRYVL